jgi:hypothetical protein
MKKPKSKKVTTNQHEDGGNLIRTVHDNTLSDSDYERKRQEGERILQHMSSVFARFGVTGIPTLIQPDFDSVCDSDAACGVTETSSLTQGNRPSEELIREIYEQADDDEIQK